MVEGVIIMSANETVYSQLLAYHWQQQRRRCGATLTVWGLSCIGSLIASIIFTVILARSSSITGYIIAVVLGMYIGTVQSFHVLFEDVPECELPKLQYSCGA